MPFLNKSKSNSSSKPHVTSSETEHDFQKKMQHIHEDQLEKEARAQAESLGLGYVDLRKYPILLDTLGLVPQEFAEAHQAISFLIEKEVWHVAMRGPLTDEVTTAFETWLPKSHAVNLDWFFISEASYQAALKQYAGVPVLKRVEGGVEITAEDLAQYESEIKTFHDLAARVKGLNVSQVLTLLLAGAMRSNASDIHIEAEEKGIQVRYRIDGILYSIVELPHEDWKKIISRLKLLSGLKINITDKPQDGHCTIFLGAGNKLELRVSTLPTNYGESVVMRLLRGSVAGLKFEDLGLTGKASEQLLHEMRRPNGMIISCGPTGSGKTTTLYAMLNKLNSPETKIITLEDPIEYKLPGINQSQVDTVKGYTFAAGLKSALRQDPDLIMVGEIRDLETADVSVNAALTGHLMLSTMHTNSASGALPRFLAMGVKPFLLAPALNAIIGQRLVRRLCQACKQENKLDAEMTAQIKKILSELAEPPKSEIIFYKSPGCEKCAGLGYQGRVGLYEVLVMTKEIEAEILRGQMSEYVVQEIAIKRGMVTLVQDGLLKALQGITSVEEVFRVTE